MTITYSEKPLKINNDLVRPRLDFVHSRAILDRSDEKMRYLRPSRVFDIFQVHPFQYLVQNVFLDTGKTAGRERVLFWVGKGIQSDRPSTPMLIGIDNLALI
jgi:hypothetical protein